MIPQIFKDFIATSFAENGVDNKYFPQYEAKAISCYEFYIGKDRRLKRYKEEYGNKSVDYANKYIKIYIQEVEKGHGHIWSDAYAGWHCNLKPTDSCGMLRRYTADIDDEDERDKEITIHAKSINEDPVFVKRFKELFYCYRNNEDDIEEWAKEFTDTYHKYIAEGRSEVDAYGIALKANYDLNEYPYDFNDVSYDIFAKAYEKVKEQSKVKSKEEKTKDTLVDLQMSIDKKEKELKKLKVQYEVSFGSVVESWIEETKRLFPKLKLLVQMPLEIQRNYVGVRVPFNGKKYEIRICEREHDLLSLSFHLHSKDSFHLHDPFGLEHYNREKNIAPLDIKNLIKVHNYGQIYETFIYFNDDDFDLFFRKADYKEVFQLFIEVVKAAISCYKT